MDYCDLHIHSYFSDGTFSPSKIVDEAKRVNLSAISITDHDEIAAVVPAISYGKERGIRVISGVELSAIYRDTEIHILGFLFDENERKLNKMLSEMREYREERAKKILRKLENFGIKINFHTLKSIAGEGAIGRPHIAQAMLDTNNINGYKEAFKKYIGNGKPCNVPKFKLDPIEAINLIRCAGGIPVLSHPGNIADDEIFLELINLPFAGLEVWHPDHSSRQISWYLQVAHERNFLTTGGSDNHGDRTTKVPIGGIAVDASIVDSLIDYKNTYL